MGVNEMEQKKPKCITVQQRIKKCLRHRTHYGIRTKTAEGKTYSRYIHK